MLRIQRTDRVCCRALKGPRPNRFLVNPRFSEPWLLSHVALNCAQTVLEAGFCAAFNVRVRGLRSGYHARQV